MSLEAPQPTAIERLTEDGRGHRGIGLLVTWSDGLRATLESNTLRKACPCATCKELSGDESHSKPLTSSEKKPNLLNIVSATDAESTNLERVWAVGNYAIGMRWQDGHDSGIYSYMYLRALSEQDAQQTK